MGEGLAKEVLGARARGRRHEAHRCGAKGRGCWVLMEGAWSRGGLARRSDGRSSRCPFYLNFEIMYAKKLEPQP